ncbi:hypothetical protein OIU84_004374 [Salix udensis]|uniref:Uncharacterized protein n=1 Tax=Salix udensis TaxID=889485 RepID=A0AAD6K206_9ROSI|nr:hypothetical protein OIU84_004374 [Salix udensis]
MKCLTQPAEIKVKLVGYYSYLFSNNRWNRSNIGSDSRSACGGTRKGGYFGKRHAYIDAVWSCDDGSKAPGSDGFDVAFYKEPWHLVGEDIFEMVAGF